MAHSYSRDKLEENRRKKAAAAAQTTIKVAPVTNPQKVVFGNTAKTNKQTATAPKAAKPSVMPSVTRTDPQKVIFGKPSVQQTAPKSNKITITPKTKASNAPYNPKTDTTRRATAARNRESQRKAVSQDYKNLQINQQKWHLTNDPAQKASLHQQNDQIRKRLGLIYANGATYTQSGKNLSLGMQMLHGRKAGAARQFDNVRESKEFNARAKDQITARPTIYQTMQGVTKDDLAGQTGQNAHKAMRELFNRSGETWNREDTATRDRARQELTNEMYRIFERYGLNYVPRENNNAADVMRKLRAAGADNQTLAYVQENIDLRAASDRLGQGAEAVTKRWAASVPSLIDTARQTSENAENSRRNSEYTQLEEQEKNLELTLAGMNSTDANGQMPADYKAVYDQLQEVRRRKNELAANESVDPNKWSQRTLREANEAQLNATAGLASAPRWLAEQGISLAGNAPTMAASAIPVVGPALGSAVMGAFASGQRAFELNEQGKSAGEALGRGLTSGIIEAASEKLPLEKMADILHSGGAGAVSNILKQMGVEAGEETASYLMNYAADLAAADPDAKFSLSELVQSAFGGAFGGLVFGAAGAAGARLAGDGSALVPQYDAEAYERTTADRLRQQDAELRAAQNLPDGPAKEYAVRTAQEKMAQTLSRYTSQNIAEQAETAARNEAFEGEGETTGDYQMVRSYEGVWGKDSVNERVRASLAEQANSLAAELDNIEQKRQSINTDIPASMPNARKGRDEELYQARKETRSKLNQINQFRELLAEVENQAQKTLGWEDESKKSIRLQTLEEIQNAILSDTQQFTGKHDAEIAELQVRLADAWKRFGEINQRYNIKQMVYPDGSVSINPEAPRLEPSERVRTRLEIEQLQGALQDRGVTINEDVPKPVGETPAPLKIAVETRLDDWAKRFEKKYGAPVRFAPNEAEGVAPTVHTGWKLGDKVRTWERNNLGYVTSAPGDMGVLKAWFANRETGKKGEHIVLTEDAMRVFEPHENQHANDAQIEKAAFEALNPSLNESTAQVDHYQQAQADRHAEYVREAVDRATERNNGPLDPPVKENTAGTVKDFSPREKRFVEWLGTEQGNEQTAKRTAEKRASLQDELNNINWLSDTDYAARHERSADLRNAWEQVRQLDKRIEQVREGAMLSSEDERLLQSTIINHQTTAFDGHEKQGKLLQLYQLAMERNGLMQPLNEYSGNRREAMDLSAAEAADLIAEHASDKKFAAAYNRETMERNHYDIFGKEHRADAEKINGEYIEPVHKAVADKTKYVSTVKERIEKLKLDKHESAMVQMLMERETGALVEYARINQIDLTPKLADKLRNAAQEFRSVYDDVYQRLCDTLIANGMWDSIPGYLKDYAPHFTLDKPETMLQRIRFALGLGKDSTLTLPTDLAGITDEFRPGKKWFGNLLERKGEITDFDAVAGFERYINTAGDVIFLTDSVQNLRALEDAVRYRLSDEGTRAEIDKIRNDISLDSLGKYKKIDEAYDDNADNVKKLLDQKHAGMAGYVSNLHEYINNLAGKKSKADRGWEDMLGRQVYSVARNMEGRVAANMIAANPGSWITNFIPITQAAGEVSTANLLRAMKDTLKSAIKDDGFEDASAFLTNRRGVDSINKTATRYVSDFLGKPMECIDMLTANVVTRGKYLENVQKGMDTQVAFDDADRFAANLMADFSQGAKPTAFNAVNPIRKVFTVFQLEVNNQLSYLFKDLPRAKQNAGKLAWAYTKIFAGAYAFNLVYHELTGRDSAFDPIGMIAEAFGFDPLGDDEDKEKKKPVDVALSLGSSVAENLPFVGGVLGGGRVPIAGALPSFSKITEEYQNGYSGKRIAQDAIKEALKPTTYLLLPFGGGAINKAVQGYATMKAGGSYTLDKNGENTLQFPVFGQKPADWAKAMIFGKSSLKEAQNWSENGYDSLNADETEVYETLKSRMNWDKDANGNYTDNSEAVYAAIKAMKKITAEAKAKYGNDDVSTYRDVAARQVREMLLHDDDLTLSQKGYLDRELVSGGESANYSSENAFKISQDVREARQPAAFTALEHGISPEVFSTYDQVLQDLGEEVDENGDALYTTDEKLGAIMEQVREDTTLSDGMKQAIADYVLISAMDKSAREKWTDEVQGKVNASDYVRFRGDLSTYKKEYKGTGADNNANVTEILRGYTDLTDDQRDVLMNVYSETEKNNPFHISDLEKKLTDNSFYKDLTDSGRAELRTYCNEYEQAIADGKELSGWKAKAYMAKEADISPETYALFQTALKANDYDGNGSYKADEITAAVKCIPNLTDKQRGYLWQAAKGGKPSKNNPWGTTNVTAYTKQGDDAVNPVDGGTITSGFGPRSQPTAGASTTHKAIDIAAAAGTPVKAAMAGKVVAVYRGYNGGYGNTVEIDHGNGIVTKYHHMQDGSVDGVSVGQEVATGQQIGKVGSTGKSTGPHLDFQVQKDGDFVDPRNYIPGYGTGNDYVYSGSTSAGVIASGKAAAASTGSKKSSGGKSSGGSSGSSGLKSPKNPKSLPKFG